MHKSRLAAFMIDCQTDDLEGAARFWSQALGRPIKPMPQGGLSNYIGLDGPPAEPVAEVQKVAHESRVHLDIETDDIDAEVARLEALGAKLVERIRTWVVMQAPTGQRFCVVRPQRPDFPANANQWD